jgi:hypothetical protein
MAPQRTSAAMGHGSVFLRRRSLYNLPLLLLLASAPAFAANKQAQERAARKACLSGNYDRGVDILAELFVDTKNPTYVFNQGRCFEQNSMFKEAISHFEEYLRLSGATLSGADRTDAEKHIADCKAHLPEEATAQVAPARAFVAPLPPPAGTLPAEPATLSQPAESVAAQKEPLPAHTNVGAGLRGSGIVLAAVGVAAAGAGLFFNIKANSMVDEWETKPGAYSSGHASTHQKYTSLMWAGYGLGAACVATGAILYAVGLKARNRPASGVALLPLAGPGQAGALLTGAF